VLLAACRPPAAAVSEPSLQVRFRPDPEPTGDGAELVLRVPEATWDEGLARATALLVRRSGDRSAHLSVEATAAAQAIAGYPGQGAFAKEVNGGGFPSSLAEQFSSYALLTEQPVDVGLARRNYGDGLTLWVGAVARRPLLVDPMPRDIGLDEPLAVKLETDRKDLLLFVAPPMQPVRVYEPQGHVALWLDIFHVPGTYTFEVVDPQEGQVLLLWDQFVETAPEMPSLEPLVEAIPNPIQATDALYEALNALRAEIGLAPVTRFENFEPLAREHAALMAHHGQVAHVLPGLAPGVPARAAQDFVPMARHHEDIAAAYSWEEALEHVKRSPGHLRNLLCESCTHASIGVALEPVLDQRPRLFVVWELLEFPSGLPERKPW